MAALWQQNEPHAWNRLELTAQYFGLRAAGDSPVVELPQAQSPGYAALLACYPASNHRQQWALFDSGQAEAVLVNGEPMPAGLILLKKHDEILLGGRTRLYFSTEELPVVVPYPGGATPEFCARCHKPLVAGAPAVRCPSCGRWCDQTAERPCWTYGPACPLCGHPTAFDADLRWTPEHL